MNNLQKVMYSGISDGISPFLPPDFTKFMHFFADVKKFSHGSESPHFLIFSAKFEQRDGHGISRNSHGKNNGGKNFF